ncbi:MAG: rod shape-determining protein MreC [Patescibacteria group bacterium]|nr:rod shape-determining protein MreC [Patescibacteria group bacterium]
MKSPQFFLVLFLTLFFLFLAFFYRGGVNGVLQEFRALNLSFWDGAFDYQRFRDLELENQGLLAKLGKLEEGVIISEHFSYQVGQVYSRYPFNDRRFVVINIGARDGIEPGMPVLINENILLGKVKDVLRSQSVVETVFNPEWRSSVIIGSEDTKALLKGGTPPSLDLISLGANINLGDEVLNISPDFPLNLLIGTIGEVKPVSNEAWLAAELTTLYRLENINKVLVITDFP